MDDGEAARAPRPDDGDRSTLEVLVPAVGAALVSAWFAALTLRAAPTGHERTDVVLTALLAAVVTFLGATARPLPLVTAAVVALVAGVPSGYGVGALVGAALAVALVVAERRRPLPPALRAVVAATSALLSVHALLHLRPTEPARATAVVAAVGLVPIAWSGWRRLDAPVRRVGRWALGGVAVLALAGGATGAAVGLSAASSITSGVDHTEGALGAVREGDQETAGQRFHAGEADLAAARSRTRAWWALPARHTPIVAQQVAALDAVADGGARAAGLAAEGSDRIDADRLRIVDGRLDPQVVVDAGPVMRDVARGTEAIAVDVEAAAEPSVWHLPVVSDGLVEFRDALADAEASAQTGALAAELGPELLGADGVARYFVAFVSPSEARGTGFLGNYGLLTVTDGRIELETVGRNDELTAAGDDDRTITGPPDYVRRYLRFAPQHTWENVTMTPDGPTAAEVIAEMYVQSGGTEVDGVIRIDPTGLGYLLQVTGPITVPGLPYALESTNVVHFLQFEQYRLFEVADERSDLLGVAAERVFQELTTGAGPAPAELARAMGGAVEGGHVTMWLRSERGAALVERLGVTGAVPAPDGDGFGVVGQNGGGNKIDAYLDRTVRYDATVDATTGRVEAVGTVELHNRAPASGEPTYLIGNLVDLPVGTNRTWLSLYSPHDLVGATVDGVPVELVTERELGRNVWSLFVDIPPGGTVVVEVQLEGGLDLADGSYRFDLLPQVTVVPDDVEVSVRFEGAVPQVRDVGRAPDGGVVVDGDVVRARATDTQGPWTAAVDLVADG